MTKRIPGSSHSPVRRPWRGRLACRLRNRSMTAATPPGSQRGWRRRQAGRSGTESFTAPATSCGGAR